jgi:hypothetical protein
MVSEIQFIVTWSHFFETVTRQPIMIEMSDEGNLFTSWRPRGRKKERKKLATDIYFKGISQMTQLLSTRTHLPKFLLPPKSAIL